MKFSAAAALLAVAIGASAHPGSHAHRHFHRNVPATYFRNVHAGKIPVDGKHIEVKVHASAGVAPELSVPAPKTPSPPAPPASEAPASPPPAPAPMDDASGPPPGAGGYDGGDIFKDCQAQEGGLEKRATLAQIKSPGNVGSPYGCNIKFVSKEQCENTPYCIEIPNVGSEVMKCALFNKAGPPMMKYGKPDFPINGFFKENIDKVNAKTTVEPNMTKYAVMAPNSRGGLSCSPDELEYTNFGQIAGTWVEFDFANKDNQQKDGYGPHKRDVTWSGADASALAANANNMPVHGLRVCKKGSNAECSVVCPGSGGHNAYLTQADVAADGLGLNIPGENVRLVAEVGYKC